MPATFASASPIQALAYEQLVARNVPWFDDNPYAWESWRELGFDDPSNWNLVRFQFGAASALTTRQIGGTAFLGQVTGRWGTALDVKPRLNQNTQALNVAGAKNTPVDVKLLLPTPLDLLNFVLMNTALLAAANARKAVQVTHPSLSLLQANALYLFEEEAVKPPQGSEPASVTLHFKSRPETSGAAVARQGSVAATFSGLDSRVAGSTANQPTTATPPRVRAPGN
jgi:hypothetical protein